MGTRTVKFRIKNRVEIRFKIEDFAFTSAHLLEPNPWVSGTTVQIHKICVENHGICSSYGWGWGSAEVAEGTVQRSSKYWATVCEYGKVTIQLRL